MPLPWLDRIGPAWTVVLAITSLGVIPFGSTYLFGDRRVSLVVADLDGSVLLPVAFVCMSALAFALMGWSVRDSGARRACLEAGAQVLSYGGALALAVLPLALFHGSLDLVDVVARQDRVISLAGVAEAHALPWPEAWPVWASLPGWGVFLNPLAVVLVVITGLGALRLPPFDQVSAEAEARTSLHTEGSGLRLGNAVLADGVNGVLLAAYVVSLGLGGWSIPWLDEASLTTSLTHGYGPQVGSLMVASLHVTAFVVKFVAVHACIRLVGRRIAPLAEARMIFLCFRLFVPLAIINVFMTGYWLVVRPGVGS